VEAMEHILNQATNMFQNLYSNQPPFQRKQACRISKV
jgi:exportin-5